MIWVTAPRKNKLFLFIQTCLLVGRVSMIFLEALPRIRHVSNGHSSSVRTKSSNNNAVVWATLYISYFSVQECKYHLRSSDWVVFIELRLILVKISLERWFRGRLLFTSKLSKVISSHGIDKSTWCKQERMLQSTSHLGYVGRLNLLKLPWHQWELKLRELSFAPHRLFSLILHDAPLLYGVIIELLSNIDFVNIEVPQLVHCYWVIILVKRLVFKDLDEALLIWPHVDDWHLLGQIDLALGQETVLLSLVGVGLGSEVHFSSVCNIDCSILGQSDIFYYFGLFIFLFLIIFDCLLVNWRVTLRNLTLCLIISFLNNLELLYTYLGVSSYNIASKATWVANLALACTLIEPVHIILV